MGSFSLVHWLVIIVILLLVFGPKRLSEVGKGLGQGIRNFKKGLEGQEKEGEKAEEEAEDEPPPKKLKQKGEPKKLKAAKSESHDDDEEAESEEEPKGEPAR